MQSKLIEFRRSQACAKNIESLPISTFTLPQGRSHASQGFSRKALAHEKFSIFFGKTLSIRTNHHPTPSVKSEQICIEQSMKIGSQHDAVTRFVVFVVSRWNQMGRLKSPLRRLLRENTSMVAGQDCLPETLISKASVVSFASPFFGREILTTRRGNGIFHVIAQVTYEGTRCASLFNRKFRPLHLIEEVIWTIVVTYRTETTKCCLVLDVGILNQRSFVGTK